MNDLLRQMSTLALSMPSRQRFTGSGIRISTRAASNWTSTTTRSSPSPLKKVSLFSDVTLTNHRRRSALTTILHPTTTNTTSILRQFTSTTTSRSSSVAQDAMASNSDLSVSSNALSATDPSVITNELGEQYGVLLDTRHLPKLKPSVVQRRINKLKTYVGTEKGIRQSPWKLNRVCQLASGLTLEEALTQLQFCDIKNADLLAKVLKRTSNLADIRDGLQMSQLEVAECFTTKGMMLKRIKRMGRGRHGIMHHKFSHIRVVLREIDFKLKIFQAKTLNQKKKWLALQMRADRDGQEAAAKRKEMEELLKQQEQQAKERSSKKE